MQARSTCRWAAALLVVLAAASALTVACAGPASENESRARYNKGFVVLGFELWYSSCSLCCWHRDEWQALPSYFKGRRAWQNMDKGLTRIEEHLGGDRSGRPDTSSSWLSMAQQLGLTKLDVCVEARRKRFFALSLCSCIVLFRFA